MTLEIDVVTLFPAMVEGPLGDSIPARIQEQGLADDPDPRPARVGDRPAPVRRRRAVRRRRRAWSCASSPSRTRSTRSAAPIRLAILLDPAGEVFRQARAADLATRTHLILVCPRYEGVDERIRSLVDLELSIGDYVLTGGELPALVVIDAVLRLLPGAIDEASTDEESFSARAPRVPAVHAAGRRSAAWTSRPSSRRATTAPSGAGARTQALARTRERRPDLLEPSAGED